MISNPVGWTGGVLGGGEIRAVEILKRWHLWGIHVETLETSPSPSLLMAASYNVHKVSPPLRRTGLVAIMVNMFIIFSKYLWMLKHIKSRFDVIVAATSNLTDVFPAWFISKLQKTPLVITFQISSYTPSFLVNYGVKRKEGGGVVDSLIMGILSLLVIKLARKASATFCLSKPILSMLRELGFPMESLYLTSMGLNHKEIDVTVTQGKRYDGVFLGRVQWAKGVHDLLSAWKILTQKIPNAILLIAGAGDFLEEAQQYVRMARMNGNVRFSGFVAGKKKYEYLKSGRVFIYPSRIKEGWGLAIAEAMTCGLPVVCTDNPVFLSLFSGCKSVFFVPAGDVEGLAEAILHLLSDKDSLRSYSEVSKAYAQEYNWETVARRELNILKNICKSLAQEKTKGHIEKCII